MEFEFELVLELEFELELELEFELVLELEFLDRRAPPLFLLECSSSLARLACLEGLVGFRSLIVRPSAGSDPSSAACSAAPIPNVGTSPAI